MLTTGGEAMNGQGVPPSAQLRAKYLAAQQAGLLGRVMEVGWAGLTAKESGRIGGILSHRKQRELDDVR